MQHAASNLIGSLTVDLVSNMTLATVWMTVGLSGCCGMLLCLAAGRINGFLGHKNISPTFCLLCASSNQLSRPLNLKVMT